MAIELISTIRTKNNGSYAIAIANEIQGGLHSKNSIRERDSISKERLIEGMLCYVGGEVQSYYKWDGLDWQDFTTGNGGNGGSGVSEKILYRVTTYNDMISISNANLRYGYLCHVELDTKGHYMYYYSTNGWTPFTQSSDNNINSSIWIGDTPPEDTSVVWIDTSDNIEAPNSLFDEVVAEFTKAVTTLREEQKVLKDKIAELEKKIESGIVPPPVEPPTDDINYIVSENGDRIITEDGNFIISEDSNNNQ